MSAGHSDTSDNQLLTLSKLIDTVVCSNYFVISLSCARGLLVKLTLTGRVTSVSTFSVISLKSIMLTANVLLEKFKQNLKMLKRIIPLSQEVFIYVTVS